MSEQRREVFAYVTFVALVSEYPLDATSSCNEYPHSATAQVRGAYQVRACNNKTNRKWRILVSARLNDKGIFPHVQCAREKTP
jgi:hypothetical protein